MDPLTEPYMEFPFQFISPIVVVQEVAEHGVAMISGTLLVEGMSRNKNLYTIEEMAHIADEVIGKPMYFGTKSGVNPNTGKWSKQIHDDSEPNKIGKIISTKLDALKRRITFIAEVANTSEHPDLVSKVKSGWGVSIGGFVKKAKYVLNAAKELCVKIENMIVEHVSLVPPEVVCGQDEAKVETVAIQEVMIFDEQDKKLVLVIEGKGVIVKDAYLE